MLRFILHQLWRIFLFILGVVSLIYIVQTLWPTTPNRFTIFLALLTTYCVMAYVVIPALFRMYHFFIAHDHIPLYATYGDGWASDPVNIAIIVKNRAHLERIMKKAGWYSCDPVSFKSSLKIVWSVIFNKPYPTAPLSSLFLFNRPHDIGFQMPSNDKLSARTRHHIRFWKLQPPTDDSEDRGHFKFWSGKLQKWFHQDHEIWIGACTEDFRAIDIRWRTGAITHGTRHDTDRELEFIIETLQKNKQIKSIDATDAGEKFKFRGQSFRTVYTTDGSLRVIHAR